MFSMKQFILYKSKSLFVVLLLLLSFTQGCKPTTKSTNNHSESALDIADSILYNILNLYDAPRFGLLTETYPINPDHRVSYLADESAQKKEQEVSFLWPYSGIISGTISLYKESTDNKYLSLLKDRLLPGLELYWDTTRVPYSYQSYPTFAGHSDRFYDDNVWLALDFCTLYETTQESKYLERAKDLYTFIYSGWSDELGGGIFWCEQKRKSKNTCSNAPATVLGVKLYELTNDELYLEKAIETYKWTKDNLLDPADNVYWDNISLEGTVDKRKYTYNSGQMIEAAVLLYKHTKEKDYLSDAQKTAFASYQFFTKYKDTVNGEQLFYPNSPWFNVILFRGLKALCSIDKNPEYINTIRENAYYAWYHTRDGNGLFGNDWSQKDEGKFKWLLDNACMVELFSQLSSIE